MILSYPLVHVFTGNFHSDCKIYVLCVSLVSSLFYSIISIKLFRAQMEMKLKYGNLKITKVQDGGHAAPC